MTTVSTADPRFGSALDTCVAALRQLATYELEPGVARRMDDLGERKEFLAPQEHEELLALATFTQRRTLEKLQAELALRRLHEVFPELVNNP